MKVEKQQIFNLMDTNGRRNDVINALQGYLSILDNINMNWGFLPNSSAQYEFYKQAIALSPDVFKQHVPYDNLISELNIHPEFKKAINDGEIDWIQQNQIKYSSLIKKFDKGIEDRARHYTSNLVKLGFVNNKRKITPIGNILLKKINLNKDILEHTLPLDDINIVYLRQLLKLRIFNETGESFYSPFVFAIYLLLKKDRVSENEFCELVQGLSPYCNFENLDELIDAYTEGSIIQNYNIEIPLQINTKFQIVESDFKEIFKNGKSKNNINIYWEFYNRIFSFSKKVNAKELDYLLTFYENNKSSISKAFGYGKNLFAVRVGSRPSPADFIKQNKKIFKDNININLYRQFALSKILDQIKEYSDTTKRIFKATGIISFQNGYVELEYKELCKCIFNKDFIKAKIAGNISEDIGTHYCNYELGNESYFCTVKSLSEIFEYSPEQIQEIKTCIKEEFDNSDIIDISKIIADRRKNEFKEFIDSAYPISKIQEILELFADRNNNQKIKKIVSQDSTIPTIYEFIVGIAWYYFSGKKIDLLNSYNLTLSANFEPLMHAGGGQGDIVIYEQDKVIMLEATLMNPNSQKRGEWEPVLRHSVNLKIEEEANKTSRMVTTFFIADEFDLNTINIWKAVTAMPMQSTIDKKSFTDNVVIMPLKTSELSQFMNKSEDYDVIINKVHDLFKKEKENSNINWREEFIKKII